MGVCKVDKPDSKARRIDIKVYPKDQYGYAILYFTGSDLFNRSMRLFAENKGLTLSDHGMFDFSLNGKTKVTHGAGVPCQTEEEVFKALGLPYKMPHEREI